MSYQTERDQFIAQMTREGLPLDTIYTLLRAATSMQRYAELACSSEAADRDRIPCPATRKRPGPCLCDQYRGDGQHETIPRITLLDYRAGFRAEKALPDGWSILTQGDPRGYVLRVIPRSYLARNAGRDRCNLDAIGVPSRPSNLRF